jgi:iron(III) transport system ATP-binding protein
VVARVRSVDFYGHDSRVWLELPDGVTVSARLDGADLPSAGDQVSVTVRGAALTFPPAPGDVPQGTALAGAGLVGEVAPPVLSA